MRKPNRRRHNAKWRFYRNMRKHKVNVFELEKQVKALQIVVNTLANKQEVHRNKINELVDYRNVSANFFRDYFGLGKEKKEPFIIRIWKKVFKK